MVNNSGVFLKKSDGDTGIRVTSVSQLQNIDIAKQVDCLWTTIN